MEGEIQVKIIPQIIYLFTGCACAVAFLFLILLDLARAWKKKVYWVQGEALVLTALTIQLLNLLGDSNVSVSGNAIKKQYEVALLFEKQLLIDSGRLVLCVFIAYLLPGMARAGSASSWGNIGALSINVVVHMVSELYFLRRKSIAKLMKHREPLDINDYEFLWQEAAGSSRIWFIVSNVTISVAMILLMLLLGCAVLAGKSIRNVATQKILSALTQNAPNSDQVDSSSIDEHHVLKSWILAYTCQPDYIMARSVLSSSAGLVVTICVLLCIVKWGFLHGDIGLHRY